MKPRNGRSRTVIEKVQPQIENGRFPVKRIVGDTVTVTAAIFGDGHDHVTAQLLYKKEDAQEWRAIRMVPLGNDLWKAEFVVDSIGRWAFTIQSWVDHFDTWVSDLKKRIDAQDNDPNSGKDIALAFRTGAQLLDRSSAHAKGDEARKLKTFATQLRALADKKPARFEYPITQELFDLAEAYPDLSFSTTYERELLIQVDRERARFSSWYEFFPRSIGADGQHGTLNDAAKLLPHIAEAGFDVAYLPPIHPIGNAFRKGKNNSTTAEKDDVGSPWAIGSLKGGHTAILPELGNFADFDNLIETARLLNIEIALDIAFQCSPDHPWVRQHPEWFSIRPDGSIQYAENPPKKYQDIYPLNFESTDWENLWHELCGVFLFWAKRGVRIFRVDNPHTKALPFWEWCIREVQRQFPDTIFLAEAFTRPHVMYGLAERGFTQSYTYFTWRTTKKEFIEYLTELTTPPVNEFFRPNFWPNTPDILHAALQTGLRSAFQARAVLAATLSSNYGIYGPAFELMEHEPIKPGSEEYLNSEKYQLRQWDRDNPNSLLPFLKTLNFARRHHKALQSNDSLVFHDIDNDDILCYSKRSGDDIILTLVNLNFTEPRTGWTDLNMVALGLMHNETYKVHDLLTGETWDWRGPHNYVFFDPKERAAHVFVVQKIASQQEAEVPTPDTPAQPE